jgi:hypothetical protein
MRITNDPMINSVNSKNELENEGAQKVNQPAPPKTGVGATTDGFENSQKHVGDAYGKTSTEQSNKAEYDVNTLLTPDDVSEYFGEFAAPGTGSPKPGTGAESAGSAHLNSILNDPNLPFEEKLALFLFDFLEKAEKDLLSRMEQLDKSRQTSTAGANGKNGTQGTTEQGGVNSNQGTEGAGNINAPNTESEQIGLEKLKLAHEKMTKMFSIVDNILTSNTRTSKEGPIAALKG